MLSPDNPHPFSIADYAVYLEAVVSAIPELAHQTHSPQSFLAAVHRRLMGQFQVAPEVSAVIGDDTLPISQETIEQFHVAVVQQVFRRLS